MDNQREYFRELNKLGREVGPSSASVPGADGMPSWPDKVMPGAVLSVLGTAMTLTGGVLTGLEGESSVPGALLMVAGVLLNLAAVIYTLVAIHRFHKILKIITRGAYPIGPGAAAWLHLPILINFYWVFRWTRELRRFQTALDPAANKHTERGWLLLLGLFFSRLTPAIFVILALGILREAGKETRELLEKQETASSLEAYIASPPKKAGAGFLVILFVIFFAVLAAIAVPNFIQARNAARAKSGSGVSERVGGGDAVSNFVAARRLVRDEGMTPEQASKKIIYGSGEPEAGDSLDSYYKELGIEKKESGASSENN